ncbi:hypothetical protein GEMRC1_004719 [Eukaryota sp. GEM-RC1]
MLILMLPIFPASGISEIIALTLIKLSWAFSFFDYKLLSNAIVNYLTGVQYLLSTNTYKFRNFRRQHVQLFNSVGIIHDIPYKFAHFLEAPVSCVRSLEISVDEFPSAITSLGLLVNVQTVVLAGFDKFSNNYRTIDYPTATSFVQALPGLSSLRLVRKSNGTEVCSVVLADSSYRFLLSNILYIGSHSDINPHDFVQSLYNVLPGCEAFSLNIFLRNLIDIPVPLMPLMQNISLSISNDSTLAYVQSALAHNLPQLSILSLITPPISKFRDHLSIANSFPYSLRYLRISDVFTASNIALLSKYCPKLIELDLDGEVLSFTSLLLHFPLLRRLGVSMGTFCFDHDYDTPDLHDHPLQLVEFAKQVVTTSSDILSVVSACRKLSGIMISGRYFPAQSLIIKDVDNRMEVS